MKQAVATFDGYGSRSLLEKTLNEWLTVEPREVLGIQATDLRLFIHWRALPGHSRGRAVFVKLFKALPNGSSLAEQFASFFHEHPRARVLHRAANGSFLFWIWQDDTD
jgi:hypothetical protein